MPLRKASEIKFTDEEKAVLERYLCRRKTGRSMAQRAEIIVQKLSQIDFKSFPEARLLLFLSATRCSSEQ